MSKRKFLVGDVVKVIGAKGVFPGSFGRIGIVTEIDPRWNSTNRCVYIVQSRKERLGEFYSYELELRLGI